MTPPGSKALPAWGYGEEEALTRASQTRRHADGWSVVATLTLMASFLFLYWDFISATIRSRNSRYDNAAKTILSELTFRQFV